MKPSKPFPIAVVSGLALVAGVVLAFANCSSGGDPVADINEGYAALGSGDAAHALDHFSSALKELEPTDAEYDRARMGEIEAKVRLKPEAAAQSFLDYAEKQPDMVDAGDYHKVGMQLTERKSLNEAVAVLGAGHKRFPQDAKIDEALKATVAAAQSSGDEAALEALKGLGYTKG
jgi:TolA-binding protein